MLHLEHLIFVKILDKTVHLINVTQQTSIDSYQTWSTHYLWRIWILLIVQTKVSDLDCNQQSSEWKP